MACTCMADVRHSRASRQARARIHGQLATRMASMANLSLIDIGMHACKHRHAPAPHPRSIGMCAVQAPVTSRGAACMCAMQARVWEPRQLVVTCWAAASGAACLGPSSPPGGPAGAAAGAACGPTVGSLAATGYMAVWWRAGSLAVVVPACRYVCGGSAWVASWKVACTRRCVASEPAVLHALAWPLQPDCAND